MRPLRLLTAVLLCVASATAQALSYAELYQSVPAPSTDPAVTRAAVRDGKIASADLLHFRQLLTDEKAAIAALNGGSYPEHSDTAPAVPAADTPQTLSAIGGFSSYLSGNAGDKAPTRAMAKRSRWIQRAKGQQHSALAKRAADCAAPCEDPKFTMQRERLIGEELLLWDVLFKDWQSTRAPILVGAQSLLAASGFGAQAQTPEGRTAIARYRAAMIEEIEALFSVTELAVLRADAFSRNAADSMPDALSGATKKSKAP